MKKIFLFLLVLFSIIGFSQKLENLYGKWKGTNNHNNSLGNVIFSDEGYISFIYKGQLIDGKNFVIHGGQNNGKSGKVKYTVDFTTNPYKINLIAFFDDNGKIIEKGILKGLLKFVNNDEILILFDFDNKGYTNFTDENKNEVGYLIREKNE